MTNVVGTSVRVQNHYNEVREIVRGYFKCIMGSAMANKIAVLIPMAEEKQDYDERIAVIDKAREMVRRLRSRMEEKPGPPCAVMLTGAASASLVTVTSA